MKFSAMENKFIVENQVFKHNNVPVDLVQHCLEIKSRHANLKAFIGCDSIATAGTIHYFVVISFCNGRRGVHCIYAKDSIKGTASRDKGQKLDSIFKKLHRECEMTMALADYLVQNKVFDIEDVIVEFDYNEVPKELSNKLIGMAKGWADYSGYQHLCKIPHSHVKPKKTPVEDMVCLGNPELDAHGRPVHPEDWTDIQRSCRYADHLCRGL